MSVKPIILSKEQVLAALGGRLGQVWEPLKVQPAPSDRPQHGALAWAPPGRDVTVYSDEKDFSADAVPYLPHVPGDVLWARETWAGHVYELDEGDRPTGEPITCYAATGYPFGRWLDSDTDEWRDAPPWKSPVTMPRWASRITLKVTEVRVKRVQEITEDEAIAFGVIRLDPTEEDKQWNREHCEDLGIEPDEMEPVWLAPGTKQGVGPRKDEMQWGPTPQFAFKLSWNARYGKRFPYETNPWALASSVTPIIQNVDEYLKGAGE